MEAPLERADLLPASRAGSPHEFVATDFVEWGRCGVAVKGETGCGQRCSEKDCRLCNAKVSDCQRAACHCGAKHHLGCWDEGGQLDITKPAETLTSAMAPLAGRAEHRAGAKRGGPAQEGGSRRLRYSTGYFLQQGKEPAAVITHIKHQKPADKLPATTPPHQV